MMWGLVTRVPVLPVSGGHTRSMGLDNKKEEGPQLHQRKVYSVYFFLCVPARPWRLDAMRVKLLLSVLQYRAFSRETPQTDLEALPQLQHRTK